MQTPRLDALATSLTRTRSLETDTLGPVGIRTDELAAEREIASPRQRFLALLDYLIEDRDGAVASHVGRVVRWALALALGYLRRRVAGAS